MVFVFCRWLKTEIDKIENDIRERADKGDLDKAESDILDIQCVSMLPSTSSRVPKFLASSIGKGFISRCVGVDRCLQSSAGQGRKESGGRWWLTNGWRRRRAE